MIAKRNANATATFQFQFFPLYQYLIFPATPGSPPPASHKTQQLPAPTNDVSSAKASVFVPSMQIGTVRVNQPRNDRNPAGGTTSHANANDKSTTPPLQRVRFPKSPM
jgi:hypothetical protein